MWNIYKTNKMLPSYTSWSSLENDDLFFFFYTHSQWKCLFQDAVLFTLQLTEMPPKRTAGATLSFSCNHFFSSHPCQTKSAAVAAFVSEDANGMMRGVFHMSGRFIPAKLRGVAVWFHHGHLFCFLLICLFAWAVASCTNQYELQQGFIDSNENPEYFKKAVFFILFIFFLSLVFMKTLFCSGTAFLGCYL